jgi:hypothetical protein
VLSRSRRLLLSTVLVAAGIGASSCGGDSTSAPTTLPVLHASSLRPSASAAGFGTPSAASGRQAERATVTAIVRRYYQALNNLHVRMDAGALGALLTTSCPCRQQVRAIRSAKSKGEHYVDHVDIIKLIANLDGPKLADVLAIFDARRGGLVDVRGHHVTSAAATKGTQRDFVLVERGGIWLIDQIRTA